MNSCELEACQISLLDRLSPAQCPALTDAGLSTSSLTHGWKAARSTNRQTSAERLRGLKSSGAATKTSQLEIWSDEAFFFLNATGNCLHSECVLSEIFSLHQPSEYYTHAFHNDGLMEGAKRRLTA